ncbi:hypothetical protein H7J07_05255 [Mycobacterium koreense]|uniref:Uncharacterized protein n=1 Tax=Mycolicibacillus koreensis TaxID=1069220 RepID=A0A7I7SAU4_9MYCO|nr:hypothetical protein [Mycolicibacillus koreensis]MCV7247631.1 hypothetical protein [Mycolicibacillus koreensis]OSC30593.1 hypothetical protein B8W67_16780 [Mycolicibacillus koreensis]BBY54012.1 hypothetical protein MKOR_12630 [Mycolicibacillus koreensis]
MDIFVITRTPGTDSSVGLIDWVPADETEEIAEMRDRYHATKMDGDIITEHSANVPGTWSLVEITEYVYVTYAMHVKHAS